MAALTLFEKLWHEHVVAALAPETDLLYVDRHFFTEFLSRCFPMLEQRGLAVRRAASNFGVQDHVVSTEPGRTGGNAPWSERNIVNMRSGCARHGIRLFDVNDDDQGIAHVIGPELGITQPGMLVLCPDSHTSTHGALGTLAWGIGASEVVHVLATQSIMQRRPKPMRVRCEGRLSSGVEAKDLVLALIGQVGSAGGADHAVEFSGAAIRSLDMEGRMTVCNMAIEFGAKSGLIAPDATTFNWLHGRRFAPKGAAWDQALAYWKTLFSDEGAVFAREVVIDATRVSPQITWGTQPAHTMAVDARVPDPREESSVAERDAVQAAQSYMGLQPGQLLSGLPIDRVFIGSCTNARITDLRRAAAVVRGRKVAPHVEAWVVPGSQQTKRDAEAEGLDRVFREAGFQWRESGCSLCLGANGELVAPGARCVSTSNRNFVGRQGPGARTHLASPTMAAAAAIAGAIVDVRTLS